MTRPEDEQLRIDGVAWLWQSEGDCRRDAVQRAEVAQAGGRGCVGPQGDERASLLESFTVVTDSASTL